MSDPIVPAAPAVSRRAALKALGAGAGAVAVWPWLSDEGLLAFTDVQRRNAPPNPKVVPAARFATLQALVEAIIPADDRSPGAKDARVADYVDLLLSESDAPVRQQWIDGLAALDAEAQSRAGSTFARLDPASMDALMADISRRELAPVTPLETFFKLAKQATIFGFYTSETGIHQELQYQGNQMLPQFFGCATVDGQDCPHCKQKASGTERPGEAGASGASLRDGPEGTAAKRRPRAPEKAVK